jgi:hypothetical protein
LPGPLALTTTISTATSSSEATLHPVERIERAAILGIPMVVAVLVILLLVLDEHGPTPPTRSVFSAAAARADLRKIGTTLVIAGALVLTLGTAPAGERRVPIPLGRQDLGVASARVIDMWRDDQHAEQRVARSRLPDASLFARDVLGRQENVCVSLGVRQPVIGASDSNQESPSGSLVVALQLSHDSEPFVDVVDVADVQEGRVLACFDVNGSQLNRFDIIDLRVRPDPVDPATLTAVRLQQRRSDEEAARVVGVDGELTLEGALDYQFVRNARSYREIVFGRIGSASVLLGLGVCLATYARRSTRSDVTQSGVD